MYRSKFQVTLARAVSLYLVAGGFLFLIYILAIVNFQGSLASILTIILGLLVFAYYIIAGAINIIHPQSRKSKTLLTIALLMQSIQFVIYGVSYRCLFGPILNIGFESDFEFNFVAQFNIFLFRCVFGVRPGSSEITVMINLLPLIVLLILNARGKSQVPAEESFLEA